MKSNPRYIAVSALSELDRTRLPLTVIFDRLDLHNVVAQKDRQLVLKIVNGVLRNRDYLDRLLTLLCRQPLTRLKPFVHQALRCGLFQIFLLDRIPPSAAVNETVKAVQAKKFAPRIQGFVNGVLRESIRRKELLPQPEDPDEHGRPLLNHPNWLAGRWQNHYGSGEMLRICRHNNREPQLCLRVDSAQDRKKLVDDLEAQGAEVSDGAYAPNSLLVRNYRGRIEALDGIANGAVQVQDQAAQLAALLLAPFAPGLSWLDGCAGLGGKTTHLRALLNTSSGSICAVEPESRRYQLLEQNLGRRPEGCPVETYNQTLQEFAGAGAPAFDRIIIDAPCSGTGVIGRHPDIRWNRREQDLAAYAERQLELLEVAATLLAPEGILVYATCSIEPEENRELVERFLSAHQDFTRDDCTPLLPESCRDLIRDGDFAPLPAEGIDGFFCARLCRTT